MLVGEAKEEDAPVFAYTEDFHSTPIDTPYDLLNFGRCSSFLKY